MNLRASGVQRVVLTTDEETWADIASGKKDAAAVAATGDLTVIGDRRAVRRLTAIFSRSRVVAGLKRSSRARGRLQSPLERALRVEGHAVLLRRAATQSGQMVRLQMVHSVSRASFEQGFR